MGILSLRCPICGKAAAPDFKPFCSARCAQIDLGKWLGEDYRVPAAPDLTDGDEGLD